MENYVGPTKPPDLTTLHHIDSMIVAYILHTVLMGTFYKRINAEKGKCTCTLYIGRSSTGICMYV